MLKRNPFGPALVVAFGCAALLTGGCNNDSSRAAKTGDTSAPPAAQGTSGQADTAQKPVTLTGCLQQGDSSSSYILTAINEPSSRPTVTSGSTANGDKVEQQQLREAEHAYRLDAKNDDQMKDLVGRRVRVSGTVTDRSDLTADNNRNDNDHSAVGTSGNKDRDTNDRTKIGESDLARVDVASIEKIADSCGSAAASHNGAKGAAKANAGKSRRR